MDALSQSEIEAILSNRMPNCTISCWVSADRTLSISVTGPHTDQFTIVNIDRRQYHGEPGIIRLVREILEEMVVVRRMAKDGVFKGGSL